MSYLRIFCVIKYEVKYSKLFKKDLKRYKHNHKTLDAAKQMVKRLANDEALEPKHKDHALQGEYTEYREYHIEPDLLLIYKKQDDILVLVCFRLGSHSELFG